MKKTQEAPDWMNSHAWRKFKQASRNMIQCLFGMRSSSKRNRRIQYWARESNKWLERIEI